MPDSCTCAYMLADPYLVSDWLSLWRQAYCKAVCVCIVVETFSLKVWGNQSQRSWLAVNESHGISSSLTHCPSYFPHPPGLALFTWTWLIDRLSFCTPFVPHNEYCGRNLPQYWSPARAVCARSSRRKLPSHHEPVRFRSRGWRGKCTWGGWMPVTWADLTAACEDEVTRSTHTE